MINLDIKRKNEENEDKGTKKGKKLHAITHLSCQFGISFPEYFELL
jgi:hypothetical protein